MTGQAELNFILCGGAGINIGKKLKASQLSARTKNASYLALDASGNNRISEADGIPLERIKAVGDVLAEGSGKVQSTNYAAAEPFVDQALSQYKPGIFNIVVCGTSGGSGSVIALLVCRWLKAKGITPIMIFLHDHSSQIEMRNSVNTMRSFKAQTSPDLLNETIPYLEFENTPDKTRGEVDKQIIDRVSTLTLFTTTVHEEMDRQDILHLLNYSKHYKVPPALAKISFIADPSNYKGPVPVAVASLFESSDAIIASFPGTVIRSTGVFGETDRPGNVSQLHMILDHGDAVKKVELAMDELDKRTSKVRSDFVQHKAETGGDAKGSFFD